jgi:hypothetical protein
MTGDDYWFRPKRRGYGAGRPVAWQGWALTGGYTLIAAASGAFLLPVSAIGFAAVMIGATAAFLLISARKTEGGWRWRCGREAPAASSSRGRRNGRKGR